jgi:copper transport protein
LTTSIIFLYLIPSFNFVETSYSQSTTTIGSESETAAAITSYTDAIIKGPLLIAQALIVGVTFVHSFVLIPVIKKDSVFFNNNNSFVWPFLVNNKQFIIIVIGCGAIIFNMALILLVYQASLLSSELALDLSSTFLILLSSSVGNIFIIKLVTSTIIIILSLVYYYIAKKTQRWEYKEQQNKKHQKIKNNKISLTFCILILILGSINIFSNSIQSHNAAVSFLPFLAIFIDWIHFMMVSIWVGGLFYISFLISRKLLVKGKIADLQYSKFFKNSINIHLFLSIILRFSIIAIISMGIIFITGLYMGLLHLQQPSSLLNSPYGNILIIKLLLVFPMGLLGGYHHFRLHKFINQKIWIQINQQLQKFKIFDKSLKLEFIFGIGVIFTSSFLTITSPPQEDNFHNMDMMILPHSEQSESTKTTNNQNHLVDQFFSFITLLLSISITILVILFARQGWLKLKIYNQNLPK